MRYARCPMAAAAWMLACAVGSGFLTGQAAEQTFIFGKHGAKHVNIMVESETELESMAVISNQISGQMTWDRQAKSGHVKLAVPVASLKTGIKERDEHLRGEKWLDAAKHPEITFESAKIKHKKGDRYEVQGTFTLRGVAKTVKTEAVVKYIKYRPGFEKMYLPKGNLVRVKAAFELKLSDFGIRSPWIPAKVAKTLKVKLSLMGVNEVK